jgi:hypothetical protein
MFPCGAIVSFHQSCFLVVLLFPLQRNGWDVSFLKKIILANESIRV